MKTFLGKNKAKLGPDVENIIHRDNLRDRKPVGTNYLSDTDQEEYKDYPKLVDMSPDEKRSRILRLWRTCFNCSIGVAIMQEQKDAVITKILLFGRQLVGDQENRRY